MSTSKKADYGLDAPGLVRGFGLGGGSAVIAGFVLPRVWPTIGFGHALIWTGTSFVVTAVLMILSSRVGKLRARERILDGVALRASDAVLDVGCGRGLLLVGAARRVSEGRAVGIDLWSKRDLSDNTKAATLHNAEAEGVAERVEVRDGDMRELPFDDASFDAVVACFSIHNIPERAGRDRAVQEIFRVLKPGGRVGLYDLGRTGEYAATLRAAGARDVSRTLPSPLTFPPGRIVRATKPDES